MKSPTAAGTRRPDAIVRGSKTGFAKRSPASKARAIGAQPEDWHEKSRGFRGESSQPIASSSAKAFHMPIRPVPPPVG
jgi:hypothetical protein